MNTYEFCADWAARRGGRVLDFGCGAGQIVSLLRERGVDAYGCDVFYGGGDYSPDIPVDLRRYIARNESGRIPFPDEHFDVVVSNQVFEHVPNMATEVAEIARVLKTGGVSFNLFPDRWREGPLWCPLSTPLPEGFVSACLSRGGGAVARVRAAQDGKPVMLWARDFCRWLDGWTYYRPLADIERIWTQHFEIEHDEDAWFRARFPSLNVPSSIARFIVRRFAGLVLVGVKAPQQGAS